MSLSFLYNGINVSDPPGITSVSTNADGLRCSGHLSPAVLGGPREHLSTRQPCHSSRHAHSLCCHILLSQLFLQAKSSSGWHSDTPAAVTNEVCHYLSAKRMWHPETQSKKQGLSLSAEGCLGWKLPTTEMQGSCLADSKLTQGTYLVLRPSCAEKKAKRIIDC